MYYLYTKDSHYKIGFISEIESDGHVWYCAVPGEYYTTQALAKKARDIVLADTKKYYPNIIEVCIGELKKFK